MKYGRLIAGAIIPAPGALVINGRWRIPPTEAEYLAEGWKRLHLAEMPLDGHLYRAVYTEEEEDIYRTWERIAPPAPEPPTYDEKLAELRATRKCVSYGGELITVDEAEQAWLYLSTRGKGVSATALATLIGIEDAKLEKEARENG